ncbi:MAG: Flp pilus assembly protein CpaB, partial [Alphaproteobacteria bacterium]|nr:Flp pilus assembly protein CpaB [Alphaproteobacteria bacterium]
GRVVLRSIQTNEPVLNSKLSGAGGKATLSTILDKEMRAVTIRVNDVNGVAGFVLPGDRVDVLLTREENQASRNKNPITDFLLQNIKVLGIDQKANDDEDKPKVARAVTLEVEPFDAQKLALATTVGSLSLALRHEANADADYTRTVRVSDLKARVLVEEPKAEKVSVTSGEAAAKPAKKKRKVYVTPANPYSNVTVVRGVDASTSKVLKDKDKKARPASAGLYAPTARKPAATQEETAPGGPKIIVPQG